MTREVDPEVVADLRLREDSMRDPTRERRSEAMLGTWAPREKYVGKWKCKTPVCSAYVDVVEDTIERWMLLNGMLKARGEETIRTDEVLRCDRCRNEMSLARRVHLRKRVDEMAVIIRQLKSSSNPRGEHELIRQLEKWHHPDLKGLLDAIERRLESENKTSKRTRREDL